ncbi:MAG: AzlC family ABC transporter permease [Solirubrobacterales bacterium]|nr:AzlC family ABC transporter permease [Solirubrobacterales bacterium]
MAGETEQRARTERRASLRAGTKAGIPFAVAAGLVAVSYGVIAEPILGSTVTLAMSVFVFAGSAQFGSVAVLGAGGGVPAALTAAVLLNARYVPMGIALAPSVHGRWWKRAAYGEAMIDGSWAMADRGGGRFDPDFMVGATLPSYPMWIGGTALGVFAGDLIPDPADIGLDALFPAFFLALLLGGELREGGRTSVIVAILGGGIALALTPVTPAGVPVIAASLAALIGLRGGARAGDDPELKGDPVG